MNIRMNKTAESFEETEVDMEVKAGLAKNILFLNCLPPSFLTVLLFKCYFTHLGTTLLGGGGLVEAEEAARQGLDLVICIRRHSR